MAFTDTKSREAKEAKHAQLKADWSACHARSEKELMDERDETYKDVKLPDNLNAPSDHINYVKSVLAGPGKEKTGKKSGQVLEAKKKCLNCGSVKIMRQRDEEITKEIVWLDEYKCIDCKTRFNL